MSSKEYHREYNNNRYHKRRAEFVNLLGGSCFKCGSDEELQFDHKDPSTKEFDISERLTYSTKVILEELKKCQLLCHTCHIEKTKVNKDGYDLRAKGSQVNHAKLTEEDVVIIKNRLKTEKPSAICKDYPVGRCTIRQIRDEMIWKHIK